MTRILLLTRQLPQEACMDNKERPHGALQLSKEDMISMGYKVVDLLVDHFINLRDKPVTRIATRAEMEKKLREPLPENGTDIDVVLRQVQHDVFDNIMHTDHPRFFAFIPSPNNYVSVMADALAIGFNSFAGTWLEASGPAEIELVTMDWLRQLAGFPESGGGLFVSGGTAANLTALAVARHIKLNDRFHNAIIYCSDQTHSCIDRTVRLLGFKPEQLCRITSDDKFRLPMEKVKQLIVKDREAGKIPFCIIANAGTTNTGAVDPLEELADLCQKENLWLHIDGAYGAAGIISNKGRHQLRGLERADSLSLDPHKWLFQAYEMGSVLVKDKRWLKDTFHIIPAYLKDLYREEEEINFCDYGIQLTRYFRALKLWMSLKIFGLSEFQTAVSRGIELAEKSEEILSGYPGWTVVTPAQLGIVTFRYERDGLTSSDLDNLNLGLVDKMLSDKFSFVSSTNLKGRTVLRLCTINPRTTETDIRETILRLDRFAKELI